MQSTTTESTILLQWEMDVPTRFLTDVLMIEVSDGPSFRPSNSAIELPVFKKWHTKLDALAQLQDGWDSYSAPSPSRKAIEVSQDYISMLAMLCWEPTRVAASVVGGIGITHLSGARKVYIEFYNDGTAHALFSDRSSGNMDTFPVGTDTQSYFRFVGKARGYLNA